MEGHHPERRRDCGGTARPCAAVDVDPPAELGYLQGLSVKAPEDGGDGLAVPARLSAKPNARTRRGGPPGKGARLRSRRGGRRRTRQPD
eukprot:8049230-Alexandrium_andersonii.AAC.1